MSRRRTNGDFGKCGMRLNESVGWCHENTRYTRYTNSAAQSVPLARLRQARQRQERRSAFSTGCSGNGRNRMLRATARNTKNKSPEENFESNAPANTNPNRATCARLGECHICGNCQTVSTKNSVTTMSVITSGPNAKKVGVDTYAARHNSPPQTPPSRDPQTYRTQPNINVISSMGTRAQKSVGCGSFQRIRNQWPNTHSPRY